MGTGSEVEWGYVGCTSEVRGGTIIGYLMVVISIYMSYNYTEMIKLRNKKKHYLQ